MTPSPPPDKGPLRWLLGAYHWLVEGLPPDHPARVRSRAALVWLVVGFTAVLFAAALVRLV